MGALEQIANVLRNYAQQNSAPHADAAGHFDQVSAAVPGSVLSQGITAAFESPQTPPFHDMITQLFTNSDPTQRAAMLTTLLNAIPAEQRGALLSALGLGGAAAGASAGNAATTITAAQAQQVPPAAVTQAAEQAASNDPSIMGQLGSFYAQHPTLVKTLGSLAMIVAMRKIARHYPS